MPEQILQITEEEFNRRVEERVRANAAGGAPVNTRPNTHAAPTGTAWRGSSAPNASAQSTLTQEQARNVLDYFRGVNSKDTALVTRALVSLGAPQERLQQLGVLEDGGYTAPEQFVSEVLIELPKLTPFADPNLVRIVPMSKETMRWTKVKTRPTDPEYVAEGAVYTKKTTKFSPITLVAKKIGEIIPFTEEVLMANEIAMVQVIAQLVAESFAFKYNYLVTSGDGGATEPEGVLTNENVVEEPFVNTTDLTKADSFINVFHALQSQYRSGAIWLLHDSTIKMARKLRDSEGRYIWTDGFGATPSLLLGRPVFENPDLPTSKLLFGDFKRGYIIGKREGMAVSQNSSGEDWEKDIVNFKFRERWDGRVHDEKAFVIGTGIA